METDGRNEARVEFQYQWQRLQDLGKQINSNNHGQRHGGKEIVDIIVQMDTTNTKAVQSLTVWLTQLLSDQKLELTPPDVKNLLNWLAAIKESRVIGSFLAVRVLAKAYPTYAAYWKIFQPECSQVLCCLGSEHKEWNDGELIMTTIQCIDMVLGCLVELGELSEQQEQFCTEVANAILRLHYKCRPVFKDAVQHSLFLLHSLTSMGTVCSLCPLYSKEQVAELFGLAKAYMQWGMQSDKGINDFIIPQKVYASQQAVPVSEEEEVFMIEETTGRNVGGKMSKARKPRAVAKATRQIDTSLQRRLYADETTKVLLSPGPDIKTSDSDVSETEGASSKNVLHRHRSAKIRLASIALLSVVARAQERRQLYGYWHTLLMDTTGETSCLLTMGLKDSATRCRSAALQLAAQMLYRSKNFLNQAENDSKSRVSAFMPFSHSLGLMVLSMYQSLTSILTVESSLPVLIQALKCLALLVQATPFHKFQAGFVASFVHQVRSLMQNHDTTVEVSALMVLEFLVAVPEWTSEITKALGFATQAQKLKNVNCLVPEIAELTLSETEEEDFIASDHSDSEAKHFNPVVGSKSTFETVINVNREECESWLLLRVLQNLACTTNEVLDRPHRCAPTAVRIESLQVVSALAPHFAHLNFHLPNLAASLKMSLQATAPPDVRLCAARCLDTCAYHMSSYLLQNATVLPQCSEFWTILLPIVMESISCEQDQTPALKMCLCDALSNIGVVLFESLSHTVQMQLISFLSGVSSAATDEDSLVCATATRALAMFVLFPSLHDDLVFVENAAELALRLMVDSNVLVRIKAQWSLGNISEALVATTTQERISENLLERLITTALTATSDNDKVRCNAVRALGNLLRLLKQQHFEDQHFRELALKCLIKLGDCIRGSGNAKVKWNACYAVGNIMQHHVLFTTTMLHPAELNWRPPLFNALCHVIVNHNNFKVRINAATVVPLIAERNYFGEHFELFWSALLTAIEESARLDSFIEYNHRDQLQQKLCLALCHLVNTALSDDFIMLKKHLVARQELVQNIWMRVSNRMLPEKVAPLVSCALLLRKRFEAVPSLLPEQKSAIAYIAEAFVSQ